MVEDDTPNRLPDHVLDVLMHPDGFELLSLDPSAGPTRESGHFWGWRILGATPVESPSTRREVVQALQRGIAENTGWVAACFDPRHGIRATRGGSSVDLVVCFECVQAYLYPDGKWAGSVRVSGSPEAVFDRLLTAAGVTLAAKRA